MAEWFDKGDLLRVEATFRDLADELVDPATVTFKAKPPSGDVRTEVGAQDSEGVYHAEFDLDVAGSWHLRVESTGIGQAAEEATIRVRKSAFD